MASILEQSPAKSNRALCAAALVVGLMLCLPAFAQTKPPNAAASEAQKGKVFGDWRRQCDPPKQGKPASCYILQRLIEKQKKRDVMALAIGYYGEKQIPAAVVRVPLGIYLPAGLTLTVPGAEPARIVVETCTTNGCTGGTALTDDLLAAMKKGDKAEVSLEDAHRRKINLPVSLKGFTQGFASLTKH